MITSYLRAFLCSVLAIIACQYLYISNSKYLQERKLNFTQIGFKYGFPVEEHSVTTNDSYILKVFHIPGEKKPPVLLMHGFIDSADTFIIRGDTSLAITLAKAGYDVWVANTRGNRYARQHMHLNPDEDSEFWNFSFHEMGVNDLPALIDFILNKTDSKKLDAVAHSLGNTMFYVMGAVRPEYNDKVNVLIAMSPICFFNNVGNAPALLLKVSPLLNWYLQLTGQEELLGEDTLYRRIYVEFCDYDITNRMCSFGLFQFAGSDPDELEPEFFRKLVQYYPSGSSRKTGNHVSQIGLRKSFSHYDYGSLNIDLYNSTDPPEYDLNKVTMKVALLFGLNDQLSKAEDVKTLMKHLPNVVEYLPNKYDKFNHVDAMWGRNMDKYLYPELYRILERFRPSFDHIR